MSSISPSWVYSELYDLTLWRFDMTPWFKPWFVQVHDASFKLCYWRKVVLVNSHLYKWHIHFYFVNGLHYHSLVDGKLSDLVHVSVQATTWFAVVGTIHFSLWLQLWMEMLNDSCTFVDWLIDLMCDIFWREPSQDPQTIASRPSGTPSAVRSKTLAVDHQSSHTSDRSAGGLQTHNIGGVTASAATGLHSFNLNYNLGQNKMEQQTPIPPKSRMKPRKSQNAPFSHPWFGGEGGGVQISHLFCPRL